ncbi:MAG: metallopeptidase family protein [Anaerolineales bacterium]|nr:metallopeptidase family protein [Anaerolineales bacterium]
MTAHWRVETWPFSFSNANSPLTNKPTFSTIHPMLSLPEFEALVMEAMDSLPPFFQERMNNVELLVKPWPTAAELHAAHVPAGHTLLGLYRGIPLTERTSGYNLVPPDTITLYQGPIERAAAGDFAAIRAQVRHTVIHELAHHFGISDERLRELGAY